jgi:hypothetical protein
MFLCDPHPEDGGLVPVPVCLQWERSFCARFESWSGVLSDASRMWILVIPGDTGVTSEERHSERVYGFCVGGAGQELQLRSNLDPVRNDVTGL